MDVLVTDGIMKKSLSVVRTIAPRTSTTGVVASYPLSMAGVSQHVDQQHRIDRSDPQEYVRSLNAVIKQFGYDYLLPVGGWTTRALVDNRSVLTSDVNAVLPDSEAMQTAQRKWKTYQLAKRFDIPTPGTAQVTAPADERRMIEECGFPLVIKPPVESAPKYVKYADSAAELRTKIAAYRELCDDDPIVQEYLPGEGCGFFGLYLDGDCVGSYSHTRIREYPPSGGISACAESEPTEELGAIGKEVLDSLDWNGPAMVEFKRDADGTPNLIEINPKLWGSLDLGIASGLDFPTALLRYMAEDELPEFTFQTHRFHWPLSGDLQHVFHRPRAALAVARDLASSDTSSNLSVTDPLPHVIETGKLIVSPFVDQHS